MNKNAQPQQQIVMGKDGVVRFRQNAIVRWMLDQGGQGVRFDLNTIAANPDFTREDRMQLAQLIGYSVSGYGDLSYASRASVREADLKSAELLAARAARHAARKRGPRTQ